MRCPIQTPALFSLLPYSTLPWRPCVLHNPNTAAPLLSTGQRCTLDNARCSAHQADVHRKRPGLSTHKFSICSCQMLADRSQSICESNGRPLSTCADRDVHRCKRDKCRLSLADCCTIGPLPWQRCVLPAWHFMPQGCQSND